MSEQVMDESVASEESPRARQYEATSLLMLVMFAVAAGVVGSYLRSKNPIIEAVSWTNWQCFGERILGSVLLDCAIVGIVIVISLFLPRIGLLVERLVLRSNRVWFLLACSLYAIVSSAVLCGTTLGRMPHLQDEVAMVFQAEILAGGRLFADAPPIAEFFDQEFVVIDGPRWYGKYFMGASLAMVPAVWVGAAWLVSPIIGGIIILLTFILGKLLLGEKIARVATLLMAISPFRLSLCAMMMAHPVCMLALAIFALGVFKLVRNPQRWGWAVTSGTCLGFAVNTRPLTAAAIAAVIGMVSAIAMPWRRLTWKTVLGFGIPVLMCVGIYFAYNRALTGDARLTPFERWSPKDHLGFGPDVGLEYWHRPDRGHSFRKALLHNTYYSMDTLGLNLTGFGYSTLVLLAVAPFVCRRKLIGWMLAAIVLSLMIGYFFYLTPSVFAGQVRYWSETMPAMLLLVAVSLAGVRAGLPRICRCLGIMPAVRTGRAACWLAGLVLVAIGVPQAYSNVVEFLHFESWTRDNRFRALAGEQQFDNAIVFMSTRSYRDRTGTVRVDSYGGGFALNDPGLKNSAIYARDLGPAKNAELLKYFPGRRAYWINTEQSEMQFIPLEKVQSLPAP